MSRDEKKYERITDENFGEFLGEVFDHGLGQSMDNEKEIEKLRAELKALKAEREWQPIETAPKDGTEFLATDGFGNVFTVKYAKSNVINNDPFFARTSNGELWNDGTYYRHQNEYMDVAMWQPIPLPDMQLEGK